MPTTYVDYPATAAQTDFAFTFPYLEDEHVIVEIDGVQKTLTTDYTIVTSPSTKIVLTSGATAGQIVRVRRKSQPGTDLVDFENGSVLTESELDRAYLHNRYLNEEISELNDASLQKEVGGTDWDAGGSKIKNVGAPTLTADATTKQYVDDKVNQLSSGASAPPTKWVFTGDAGANTTYSVTGAEVNGDTAYDVSVDGSVLEPTTDYTVDPDTDTLTIVNTLSGGEDIVVIERGFGVAITGTIGADQLQSNAVTTAKINNSAVTTAKINNSAVTNSKIANDAVDTDQLADHSVTAVKISNTDPIFNVQTNGNVGIGTESPDAKLEIFDSIKPIIKLNGTGNNALNTNFGEIQFYNRDGSVDGPNVAASIHAQSHSDVGAGGSLVFSTEDAAAGVEGQSAEPRMTILSTGNVGIGTESPSSAFQLTVDGGTGKDAIYAKGDKASGYVDLDLENESATGSGGRMVITQGSNSAYFQYQESGENLGLVIVDGSLSANAGIKIDCDSASLGQVFATGSMAVGSNTFVNLGKASATWNNGWINSPWTSSDRNLKQDIEDLSEAELRVATALKGLMKKFRLKDAVAKKGDDARIHIGVIAQDVKAAFEAEGLDAYRYAVIGEDTWWSKQDEDGERIIKNDNPNDATYTEYTKMSVRYEQLLAFIIAAM